MIGKQWQKIKKIFSSTKAPPANFRIESFGDKNVGNKFPDKKEQPLLKDESNIKTLQQNIIVPAQNLVEDNFPDSFLPQNIDSYKIIKKIGSGGMGDVYAAHDAELHRKVAIKLLPEEFTKSKERVQRFRQEAQAASKLNHPNIITIHKIGRTKQTHYMVTEFVDGVTLRDLINRGMNVNQVLETIIQVSSALKATHEAGIIHRDIKPENIMIRRDGLVKVLDFGLAKLIESGNIDSLEVTSFHTQAGQIIGTPNYMSPEQVEGEDVDARTDLFSLGSLLYECLTGKQAFDGTSAPKILTQIVKFVPPFPSKFNSEVLPELDKVTLKLLKKNPAERFQTADEVISELNEIKEKLQGFQHPPVKNISWRANTSKLKFLYPLPGITNKFRAPFLLIPLIIVLSVFAYFQLRPATFSTTNADALKLLNSGTEALRDGTYFKASKMFEDAIKFDAGFALAHARLAEAWMELDYVGRAQNELLKVRNLQQKQTRLFEFFPTEDALYVDAVNATVLRDFPKAISTYELITQISPNESYAYLDLGRAFEKNEEIEKAIANYEKAATLNPQNGGAFLRLGTLLNRKSEFQKAFEAFDRAENIYDRQSNDEGVAEVRMQRGASLNSQEKLDAARAQFEQVIGAPRTSKYQQIRAMLQISSACCSEGKTTCAEDYASKAINLAKEERMENLSTNGLIDLGNAFLARPEYKKAEQNFQQALEFARKDEGSRNEARALLALGSLREQQNKPNEAKDFIEQALPFYQKGGYKKEVTQAYILLGRVYRKKEDYNAALYAFKQVETSGDVSSQGYAELAIGSVLLYKENFPEALSHFNQSYNLYESLGNDYLLVYSLINQSDVLNHLGRLAEAKEKLLKIDEIIKAYDLQKNLLPKVQLLQAQIAFNENDFAEAIRYGEMAAETSDSQVSLEVSCLVGLAKTRLDPKDFSGIQLCNRALQLAQSKKEARLSNTAKLALAESYLINEKPSEALTTALQVKDYFVEKGQNESVWRSLVIAARAKQLKNDYVNAKDYATKALETLSKLKTDWGEEHFKVYLIRPDIQLYFSQAEQLAKS